MLVFGYPYVTWDSFRYCNVAYCGIHLLGFAMEVMSGFVNPCVQFSHFCSVGPSPGMVFS